MHIGILSFKFIVVAALTLAGIIVFFVIGPFQNWRERRHMRERMNENREVAAQWEATINRDVDETPPDAS